MSNYKDISMMIMMVKVLIEPKILQPQENQDNLNGEEYNLV